MNRIKPIIITAAAAMLAMTLPTACHDDDTGGTADDRLVDIRATICAQTDPARQALSPCLRGSTPAGGEGVNGEGVPSVILSEAKDLQPQSTDPGILHSVQNDKGSAQNDKATVQNDKATRSTIDPATGSGTLDPGDVLGLYATTAGAAKLANAAYTLGSTALYWDDLAPGGGDVTFAACYPRPADTPDDPSAAPFNVAAASADPSAADLLLATPVTAARGNTVTLPFRHALHRLDVALSSDAFTADELAAATVQPVHLLGGAVADILAGTVDPAAAYATTEAYAPRTGAAATFILAPQPVTTGDDWLQITVGGRQFTYRVPAKITGRDGSPTPFTALRSGEKVTLRLSIDRTGVSLTSGDIAAWGNQGNIDGSIDLADGVRDITDLAGFIAALTSDAGTAAKPARYVLKADIEMEEHAVVEANGGSDVIETKGYKVIDGGGHTVTRSRGGSSYAPIIESSGDSPSSLVLTDGTFADESGSGTTWYSCFENSHWTLGKGVKVTTTGISSAMITVSGSDATLTVDGASFVRNYDTSAGWIDVRNATLILNDITFGAGDKDCIEMYQNNARLSLRPGMEKPVRLKLSDVTVAGFAITPTEGSFRAEDAMMLTVDPKSVIEGSPANADYAFYLDPDDGAIRLARKVSTLDDLKAAIAAATTGTADNPVTIVLGDDIEAGHMDLDVNVTEDKTSRHIRIDGGGHTLTYSGLAGGTMSYIYTNNSLTLTNVTMDAGGKDATLLNVYGGTVTLGGGATVANAGSGDGAYCVYLSGGTLRMKPGSAVTGAKDRGILLTSDAKVFFEGGTLSGNRADVKMSPGPSLLTVGVWPKMNGAARGKLTIEIFGWDTSAEYTVAEPAPPLASLEPGDFDLVKVTDIYVQDVTAQTELFKADDGSIKLRPKP